MLLANKLNGKNIVFTGAMSITRDTLIKIAEEYNIKISNAVSKTTDYLVSASNKSASTKMLKAKEVGTEIISEKDFIKMLGLEFANL